MKTAPLIEIDPYDRARSLMCLTMAACEDKPAEMDLRLRKVRDLKALDGVLGDFPSATLQRKRSLLGTRYAVRFEGPLNTGLSLLGRMNSLTR